MAPIARVIAAGLTLLAALTFPGPWHATNSTVGRAQAAPVIQLEPVLTGLSQPVFVTSARDGSNRLFVVEQGGVIKVLQPGSTTPTEFLNIVGKVLSGGERGLLGLAFHPGFDDNRRFFVYYTRKNDGAVVVAEYQASEADPDVADTAEIPILVVRHPAGNHNGGMMAFGPDGFLYIGLGDGGGANDPSNNAQNRNVLLGKILRIDIDHPNGPVPYSSPTTNPFFNSAPDRPEIFAYGLRNPWRFSFDRLTGDLLVGDVGQSAREEIDLVTAGGNYGWRVREGRICTVNDPALCDAPSFISPLLDYKHNKGRCSVTGGYVYRGNLGTFPAGTYVFADYCTGEIFQRDWTAHTLLLSAGFFLASFGEDEAGEIYVVDHGGAVHRIVAGPTCTFSISPTTASLPPGARSGTVSVGAPPACAWSATSNDSWINVLSGPGGAGSGTVTYSVAANTGVARTGSLTIAGRTFSVSQAASLFACLVSLNPTIGIVSSSGGAGAVAVGIGGGCGWTAVSNSPWLTITGGASGSGSGVVSYAVAPGVGFRSGSLTIAGRTFRVFSF